MKKREYLYKKRTRRERKRNVFAQQIRVSSFVWASSLYGLSSIEMKRKRSPDSYSLLFNLYQPDSTVNMCNYVVRNDKEKTKKNIAEIERCMENTVSFFYSQLIRQTVLSSSFAHLLVCER